MREYAVLHVSILDVVIGLRSPRWGKVDRAEEVERG